MRKHLCKALSESTCAILNLILMKLASRENKITTDLLQKDYEFNSPRCCNTVKHKNDAILNTLRSYMETHKPRYVNQTGTVQHLNILDKSRFNFDFSHMSNMRSINETCIDGEPIPLMEKSQEIFRVNQQKESSNPNAIKATKRNCFSTHNSRRPSKSPVPFTNIDENKKNNILNSTDYNIKSKERYNKEKEIKSVIKDDDNILWRILDKENESLDDREFVKKCSANRKDMVKDQPKSQYLINKKIIENMTKFRNILTDNKNIEFGYVRKKYLSKYPIKTGDISRLQTLLFMKKRCSLDKERIELEKEYIQEKQHLLRSLRCLQYETNKKLRDNNFKQMFKAKSRVRKLPVGSRSNYRACSSSHAENPRIIENKLPLFSKHVGFKL